MNLKIYMPCKARPPLAEYIWTNFEHVLAPAVVVNFYAPWCPWCQRLEPTWEAVTQEVHNKYPDSDGRLRFAKVQHWSGISDALLGFKVHLTASTERLTIVSMKLFRGHALVPTKSCPSSECHMELYPLCPYILLGHNKMSTPVMRLDLICDMCLAALKRTGKVLQASCISP